MDNFKRQFLSVELLSFDRVKGYGLGAICRCLRGQGSTWRCPGAPVGVAEQGGDGWPPVGARRVAGAEGREVAQLRQA